MHDGSPRRARPGVDVNCGALPDHLAESELFGYEKGIPRRTLYRKLGAYERETVGLDTSSSGFCAYRHYGALSAGQKVRFRHEHAEGAEVVIWNKVSGDGMSSGFLIVSDCK